MKKKFLACMLIMMLTITGCSSKSITQTLFVEKNNKITKKYFCAYNIGKCVFLFF